MGVGVEQTQEMGEDLVEIPKPANFTPKKRRARKLLEPLDEFLRRSKRTAEKLSGFKDESSAKKASKAVMEFQPLAIILAGHTAPAPHLSSAIVEGIATGFLQIQPEVVSAAILKQDTDGQE